MNVNPNSAPSQLRKPSPNRVTDIPFDRGEDWYNKSDGSLASRPSTTGLITLNKKTLEACEAKIQAIQTRVGELEQAGQHPDANGDFHYTSTGESVTVEKRDGAQIFEQDFTTRTGHIKHADRIHGERFEVRGDEVQVSVKDHHDDYWQVAGIPLSRHQVSDTSMDFKYAHSPEGLKYWHSDQWHLAG